MAIITSGTVSTYSFNIQRVIEHAVRRAGLSAEQLAGEQQRIATDLIFSITSEWINAGFPLWTRQYALLPIVAGGTDVSCPVGTNDVLHAYWRILNPYRGDATLTTGADAAVLFGGQPNSDVPITGINPGVYVNFGSSMEVDTIGVLLGASSSITAALQVQTAPDGATWTTVQTLPNTTLVPGQWAYFDLSPSVTAQYVQVILPSAMSTTWTLNQMNYGLANGQDIEIGPLNIDDYWNLPNKQFQSSQPNSAYTDRQLNGPVLKIWPTPNPTAFYNGTITALMRRYIQDPGALYLAAEVPQRWLEALIWRLATLLIYELPDQDQSSQASYFTLMAKQQRITAIEAKATKAEALAWAEERTKAPIKIMPNLRAYTA